MSKAHRSKMVVTGDGWKKAQKDLVRHFQKRTAAWINSTSFLAYAARVSEVSGVAMPFTKH